jgi:hypothetical protein
MQETIKETWREENRVDRCSPTASVACRTFHRPDLQLPTQHNVHSRKYEYLHVPGNKHRKCGSESGKFVIIL